MDEYGEKIAESREKHRALEVEKNLLAAKNNLSETEMASGARLSLKNRHSRRSKR